MKHCKDCEPAQQIHALAYTTVVLGWFAKPFVNFMGMLFQGPTDFISGALSEPFLKLTVFLKIAYFVNEPDDKNNYCAKCFWEEAKRRGIKMSEFRMGPINDFFIAEYKGTVVTFDGLPRPQNRESESIDWMDNKGIMRVKFKKEGIPVADGGVAWNTRQALNIFHQIQKPVITKPNLGSRSRHTTIHINTPEDLVIGFKKARKLSPLVVIEEELFGALFRGTLIEGKLVGVVRRDQPSVTGDGIHTLHELREEENKRPQRKGPLFHEITLGKEAEIELARQGMTMESIPEQGRVITFSQKTSRGCGGTTTEMTNLIHPENIKMLEHIGSFLDDPLVGVDFIMEDITRPWTEQKKSGVIECNSLPFIDLHHYPLFGEPNNVAEKLWDLVLPESKID